MTRTTRISTGIVALLIILAAMTSLFFTSTKGLKEPIEIQLADLKKGDLEGAYMQTSTGFQKASTFADFKRVIDQFPILTSFESFTYSEKMFQPRGYGYAVVVLKARDGSSATIDYRLDKMHDKWFILNMDITIPDTLPDTSIEQTPKADPPSSTIELSNNFANNIIDVKYPGNWTYQRPDQGEVIFRGKRGTRSFFSNISVQIIYPAIMGGSYHNVNEVIADMKKQISKQVMDVKFLEEKAATTTQANGKKITGYYMMFSYLNNNTRFKQYMFVINRDRNAGFIIWQYVSPEEQYNVDLPVNQAMLRTLNMH